MNNFDRIRQMSENAVDFEKALIDPIEFLEDYLGIKLLAYQKEILRRMLSTDKIYIYPWPRKISK